MAVIAVVAIRMKARHDAAQSVCPVAGAEGFAIAGHALDNKIHGRLGRIKSGFGHQATGLSAKQRNSSPAAFLRQRSICYILQKT